MADLDAKAFIRRGNVLTPADFVAEEWLQALPEGKEVLVDWRKPRHPENHRHFFAILRFASDHLPDYPDTDSLLDALKIACNHVRPVMKADGEMIFLPKSINFASMGEEEFKRFKNRALYVLSRILGFDATTLLPEIDERNQRTASQWPTSSQPARPKSTSRSSARPVQEKPAPPSEDLLSRPSPPDDVYASWTQQEPGGDFD